MAIAESGKSQRRKRSWSVFLVTAGKSRLVGTVRGSTGREVSDAFWKAHPEERFRPGRSLLTYEARNARKWGGWGVGENRFRLDEPEIDEKAYEDWMEHQSCMSEYIAEERAAGRTIVNMATGKCYYPGPD